VEGVSDKDYEDHVARDHVAGEGWGGAVYRNRLTKEGGASSTVGSASHSKYTTTFQHQRSLSPEDSTVSPTDSSHSSVAPPPSVVADQLCWTVYMSKVSRPILCQRSVISSDLIFI